MNQQKRWPKQCWKTAIKYSQSQHLNSSAQPDFKFEVISVAQIHLMQFLYMQMFWFTFRWFQCFEHLWYVSRQRKDEWKKVIGFDFGKRVDKSDTHRHIEKCAAKVTNITNWCIYFRFYIDREHNRRHTHTHTRKENNGHRESERCWSTFA